jgi:hypothetical protein
MLRPATSAVAVAVTISCGLLVLSSLASGPLTDVAPYPRMGWLSVGMYVQAALGVTAVALLILGVATFRGRMVIARLAWAVTALSAALVTVTTLVGRRMV